MLRVPGMHVDQTRPGRLMLLTVLALAGTLLLAACTSDDEDGGDGAASEASPAATDAATAAPTEEMSSTEEMSDTDGHDETTLSVATEGDLAPYLVGPHGMTLYLFTNDEPGVSNCSGNCAENWPPLTVAAGEEPTAGEGVTGAIGVIEREDGSRQVTYDDMPLYYWARDEAPGDTTGHGVGDVWFVVPPEGDTMSGSQSSTSSDSSGVPGY